MTDDSIVPTRKQAAAILGVTEKQLSTWADSEWFPTGAVERDPQTGWRKNWNVDAIRRARDTHGRKGSDLSETAKRLKLKTDHEKLLQAEIKTRIERRKLEQLEGRLIPRDAVQLFAATLLTSIGDWAEQLPDLIAAEIPKKHRAALRARLATELDARRRKTVTELEAAARDFDAADAAAADEPTTTA